MPSGSKSSPAHTPAPGAGRLGEDRREHGDVPLEYANVPGVPVTPVRRMPSTKSFDALQPPTTEFGPSASRPADMVSSWRRVTAATAGLIASRRFGSRSARVWSRLFRLPSARAMPTSVEITLFVTEAIVW